MLLKIALSFFCTQSEIVPNSLDWNGNKLEHELELEDMKHTNISLDTSIEIKKKYPSLAPP